MSKSNRMGNMCVHPGPGKYLFNSKPVPVPGGTSSWCPGNQKSLGPKCTQIWTRNIPKRQKLENI